MFFFFLLPGPTICFQFSFSAADLFSIMWNNPCFWLCCKPPRNSPSVMVPFFNFSTSSKKLLWFSNCQAVKFFKSGCSASGSFSFGSHHLLGLPLLHLALFQAYLHCYFLVSESLALLFAAGLFLAPLGDMKSKKRLSQNSYCTRQLCESQELVFIHKVCFFYKTVL